MTVLPLSAFKRTVMLASLILGGQSSAVAALSGIETSSQASQTKQPATKEAVLLIDTDDTCRLLVDGEDKGIVTPEQSQKFKVVLGEHILKCSVDGVPDLVWRKVVDVKDTSQVAAVISLKALHLQYDQAITKAKNQKEQADTAAQRQTEEAIAQEKQREAAKAEIPKKFFDVVQGKWRAVFPSQGDMPPDSLYVTFQTLENGKLMTYIEQGGNGTKYSPFGVLERGFFTPVLPNLLVNKSEMACVKRLRPAKMGRIPEWFECANLNEGIFPGTIEITIVNKDRLELRFPDGPVITLTR